MIGTQAEQGGFAGGFANGAAFEAKFVDVADENDGGLHGDAEQREQAEETGNAERRVGEFEGDERADRFGEDHAERDGDREFQIAVEREQNHENQKDGERADDVELRFGFEQFAVFAAPFHAIAFGKLDVFGDVLLARLDDAFEVAAFDGKLNADVARIIFAIDEGSAGGLAEWWRVRRAEFAGRRERERADCRCRARWNGIAAPCGRPDRKVFRLE